MKSSLNLNYKNLKLLNKLTIDYISDYYLLSTLNINIVIYRINEILFLQYKI